MTKSRKARRKARVAQTRRNQAALVKAVADQTAAVLEDEEIEEGDVEETPVAVPVLESDDEEEEEQEVEGKMRKDSMMGEDAMTNIMGPTSWNELDQLESAREQAYKAQKVTWSAEDLVANILNSVLLNPKEKASAIKNVASGFEERLSNAVVQKSYDVDALNLEVILAIDKRHTPLLEKAMDLLNKKKLTAEEENSLSDSKFALVVERDGTKVRKYPIHDKAHVRNALARAAQMLKRGGQAAKDARAALPKIRAAAKKFGIGKMEKSSSAIIVEKGADNQWRAIMWPSNNFIDLDHDIISEKAHKDFVEWINKNMDLAPIFLCHHVPGTARKSAVDFVSYENGFLMMSAPLEEEEAAGLLRAQLKTDLGMSHTSLVLERDPQDSRVVTKYLMVEVSDLPLSHAANPFTDIEALKKEANMTQDTLAYLTNILGDEEKAKAYLERANVKQKALREANVEEKAKDDSAPQQTQAASTTIVNNSTESKPNVDLDAIIKELGIEELNEFLIEMKEKVERVELLEGIVKELSQNQDAVLAEKISPPIQKALIWRKARSSESEDNLLKKNNEEDEKLKESMPKTHWLNESTHTEAVSVQ